jgi:type I restriction enzyme M protein
VLEKYTDRKDEQYFARHVDHSEISENEYSLAVATYVASEDKREIVDIGVLNQSIAEIVTRQNALRRKIDSIVENLEEDSL